MYLANALFDINQALPTFWLLPNLPARAKFLIRWRLVLDSIDAWVTVKYSSVMSNLFILHKVFKIL